MARHVFFGFKYKPDVSRAMVVRKSWVTQGKTAAGFIDAADFEEVKKKGDAAIKKWIDGQLEGTSVTVVLVGAKTCSSRWVKYEIKESEKRGNGLLGIDVSKIKDLQGNTTERCQRPSMTQTPYSKSETAAPGGAEALRNSSDSSTPAKSHSGTRRRYGPRVNRLRRLVEEHRDHDPWRNCFVSLWRRSGPPPDVISTAWRSTTSAARSQILWSLVVFDGVRFYP